MKEKILNFVKKFKKADYIIISIFSLALLIGILVYFGINKFSNSPIKEEKDIVIQVFFKNLLVSTPNKIPFKINESAFMTIRNVPYKELKILSVNYDPKKKILPANNKDGYIVVTDVSAPLQFDFLVTLTDKATITEKNEYVLGGNKIKTGLPIILEGNDFRYNGVVSAILPVNSSETNTQVDMNNSQENMSKFDSEDEHDE